MPIPEEKQRGLPAEIEPELINGYQIKYTAF